MYKDKSERALYERILELQKSGLKLRDISEKYGEHITYGDIHRILKGVMPPSEHKRRALGLPVLVPTQVCPSCGVVHVRACPSKNTQWARWQDWLCVRPSELLDLINNRVEI